MLSPVFRITVRIFALIGCIACLITKILTDHQAKRLTVRNQKYSREWNLLRNVTWTNEGNSFATVVYGGFTLITALILLTRCVNSKTKSTFIEKCFLIIGVLFFLTLGAIIFASLEQIQIELFNNAIILGTLSFFVAILFLLDLADPCGRDAKKLITADPNNFKIKYTKETQTDKPQTNDNNNDEQLIKLTTGNQLASTSSLNKLNQNISTISIGNEDLSSSIINNNGSSSIKTTIVKSGTLPVPEEPIFAKILLPEKQRAFKQLRFVKSEKHRNNQNDYLNDRQEYRPGFVAGITRMWDHRAKHGELNTIV